MPQKTHHSNRQPSSRLEFQNCRNPDPNLLGLPTPNPEGPKFFIDGDTKFPTINGTRTEDYFCGSYGFPEVYSGPYTGCTLRHANETGLTKWSLYRWHIMDPIVFSKDLRVAIRRWAGGPMENTSRSPTMYPPWATGIRRSRTRNFRSCRRSLEDGFGRIFAGRN